MPDTFTVPGTQPTGSDEVTNPSTALAPTSEVGKAPNTAIPQVPTMIWEHPQLPPEPKEITTPENLEYSDLSAADQQKMDLMISAERQAAQARTYPPPVDPEAAKAAYIDSRQSAIDAAEEAQADISEDMQEEYGEPLPEGQADKAIAGTPGTFQPESGTLPANLSKMYGVAAQPQTIWTEGQHVVLEDGSHAYWNGSSWKAGDSTVGGAQGLTAQKKKELKPIIRGPEATQPKVENPRDKKPSSGIVPEKKW